MLFLELVGAAVLLALLTIAWSERRRLRRRVSRLRLRFRGRKPDSSSAGGRAASG
jgi:hypothetical protein